MDDDDPRVVFTGLGKEVFPPVFKPLKCGPIIDVTYEDTIDKDDLDINTDHKKTIRQRVLKLSVDNQN